MVRPNAPFVCADAHLADNQSLLHPTLAVCISLETSPPLIPRTHAVTDAPQRYVLRLQAFHFHVITPTTKGLVIAQLLLNLSVGTGRDKIQAGHCVGGLQVAAWHHHQSRHHHDQSQHSQSKKQAQEPTAAAT